MINWAIDFDQSVIYKDAVWKEIHVVMPKAIKIPLMKTLEEKKNPMTRSLQMINGDDSMIKKFALY